jgi:hypothetical protein
MAVTILHCLDRDGARPATREEDARNANASCHSENRLPPTLPQAHPTRPSPHRPIQPPAAQRESSKVRRHTAPHGGPRPGRH